MTAFDRDPIFVQLGTDDLLRERECLGWDLLELKQSTDEAPSTKANAIAFIELQLQSIDHELTRRERLRSLPGAPAWPSEPTEELRAFWREIKDRILIPDFWALYFPAFPLKKASRNWRGPCPLHGGKNETSFSVYNGGRSFHCFTCNLQGDVFTLAGLVYQTTKFREIVDRLATTFGIEKPLAELSRIPTPYGDGNSGQLLRPRKRQSFEPFERRNGELVRT